MSWRAGRADGKSIPGSIRLRIYPGKICRGDSSVLQGRYYIVDSHGWAGINGEIEDSQIRLSVQRARSGNGKRIGIELPEREKRRREQEQNGKFHWNRVTANLTVRVQGAGEYAVSEMYEPLAKAALAIGTLEVGLDMARTAPRVTPAAEAKVCACACALVSRSGMEQVWDCSNCCET